MSTDEMEKYRDKDRQQEAGACIIGEARKDREPEKDHTSSDKNKYYWMWREEKKKRQEAEGELTILKGIETNRVKEAQEALANALELNESHQKLNGRIQERLTVVEEENKKMHEHLNKQLENARKSGM